MSNYLIHNIKNRLFLIMLLLERIKSDKETTDRIKAIINSLNDDLLKKIDHEIDCLVSVNQSIDDVTAIYPCINFEKNFQDKLDFIGNKPAFRDVLINIIKNSQEAGADSVKFEIKSKCLTISDNGKCQKVVIDKLNNADVFTTKENGNGIGSLAVRQFCEKQNCGLFYSAFKSSCEGEVDSMVIEIVFP